MRLHDGEQWLNFCLFILLSSNPSTQKQSVVFEIVFSLCFATISVALDTWGTLCAYADKHYGCLLTVHSTRLPTEFVITVG